MQTTMHTTRRHEPYTLLKSLCQTMSMSDGSAVTGRQYRDPCVRSVSWSLGRWGVEQAATKNKHPHRHCRNLHHTTVTSATAAISITVTSTNARRLRLLRRRLRLLRRLLVRRPSQLLAHDLCLLSEV